MPKLLLTHVPQARRQYYGERALGRLRELLDVSLHEGTVPLDAKGLIAAAAAACVSGLAAAANDVTLSLVPTSLHAESGTQLDVAVHMDVAANTPPALIGAQVVLRFDAALLEPAFPSMVVAVADGPLPALNPGCVSE